MTTTSGFVLFDTPIGRCGIAWRDRGDGGVRVTSVQLPGRDAAETRARLLRRDPDAIEMTPPDAIAGAISAMAALLSGQPRDLSNIVLDMDGLSAFDRRVYDLARLIPPGATCEYGELAVQLGAPGASRGVGRALGRNPFPLVVPCHRVVAARGRLGGFSAPGGAGTKRRLLEIEGASALERRLPGL